MLSLPNLSILDVSKCDSLMNRDWNVRNYGTHPFKPPPHTHLTHSLAVAFIVNWMWSRTHVSDDGDIGRLLKSFPLLRVLRALGVRIFVNSVSRWFEIGSIGFISNIDSRCIGDCIM